MKKIYLATVAVMAIVNPSIADTSMQLVYSGEFPRLDFKTVMPTGQSVAKECQDTEAGHPYQPYDWPNASASLEVWQGGGASKVIVEVSGTKPKTLYTMWVRLRGQDSSGNPFGGNPMIGLPGKPEIGIPGNALVPSSYMPRALDAVHNPVADPLHGFWSDESGSGAVTIELDYPIIGGALPFHRFEGFDPADPKLTKKNPRAIPVAIVGASNGAPFTLRLASHCVDGKSHGLAPGPHEGWFDWKMP